MSLAKLFTPTKVGAVQLKHRVVLSPLTRYRADINHVHGDMAVEYYAQRASTPGTLLITEATLINRRAGGYDNVPMLESNEQLIGWRKVTDAVHAKGCSIYCQIWALGRTALKHVLDRDGYPMVSASNIALPDHETPREATIAEINQFVKDFGQAAFNAVYRAGFDGVEIHGANGYLIDQFLQSCTNIRTDRYGGNITNRTRFALQVVNSCVDAVGANKVGIRLSPWSAYHGMGEANPFPVFSHLISEIKAKHPDFSYIHLTDPEGKTGGPHNDRFRHLWGEKTYISANGYTRDSALKVAERRDNNLVAFGRAFLANPDLPKRLKVDHELNEPDYNTFYTVESPKGYIDYPFAEGLEGVDVNAPTDKPVEVEAEAGAERR